MLRLGVFGANGRQGQRYMSPNNWPNGIECFALSRGVMMPCDGVIVATPPAAHLFCVQAARGVPVLCEKPMALTIEESLEIARHDAPLLIAHTHLWDRFFLEMLPSPAATVTWCGPEREDGSCPARLDWGAHAWSMAIALGTDRVETGHGDRGKNLVRSGLRVYGSVMAEEVGDRPMKHMLSTFETLIRGGEDWRARRRFALDVMDRCLKPSD